MKHAITTFRLTPADLATLDAIAEHVSDETGLRVSRAAAVRLAAREYADRRRISLPATQKKLSKKNGKKT